MTDRVRYALPLGPLGRAAHGLAVRASLAAIFDHRYERIREHLQHHAIQGSAGIALADGGQVPVGALRELDSAAWGAFEATFLTN
jgi:hypothetical protein